MYHGKIKKGLFPAAFILILVIGAILRLVYPSDIEFKSDENYLWQRFAKYGTEPWTWSGMPCGVGVKNPGLSIWLFIFLGKIFRATDPTDLSRAIAILNIGALALAAFFALKWISKSERPAWLWGIAISAVNPLAVMVQRKIWQQSALPVFSIIFLMAWWKRRTKTGAFLWGFVGAILGQIHMSGFFYAFALFVWTLLFRRREVRWRWWLTGSTLATLPMIPWLIELLNHTSNDTKVFGLNEAMQLKYWVFWLTDPFGLHLGNALGVLNGNGIMQQLSDFIRYPLINGHATYFVALLHVFIVAALAIILIKTISKLILKPHKWLQLFRGDSSETAHVQSSALWGYGLAMTGATLLIRRYYLIITYPLNFIWLTRQVLACFRRSTLLLSLIVIAELLTTVCFLHYIHVNNGAPRGDFGNVYRVIK